MRRGWLRSLQLRIFATTAVCALVVAGAATAVVYNFFAEQFRSATIRKANATGDLLAANVPAAFDLDDPVAAEALLATALGDSEVVYAIALKPNGERFAAARAAPKGVPLKGAAKARELFDAGGLVNVAVPVRNADGQVGVVQVGFSLADARAKSSVVRRAGAAAAVGIALLLSLVIFLTLRRIVVRPVSRFARAVEQMGDGDLRPREFDERRLAAEIGVMYRALERATAAFRQNVAAISDAAGQFARMADEILASTAGLTGAASDQASAISETSVTLEEVEKTGRLSAQGAAQILAAADESVKVSAEGLAAVDDTMAQLRDIKAEVDQMARSVQELDQRLDEVDKVVGSVNEVTRQSHTLSINASIEAAKAGRAGRGFAIVANKVRDLAQQSRLATDEVRGTLANIQAAMRAVVEASEAGRRRTERGVASIERTGRVIQRLSEVIRTTAEAARQIAVNANEQVVGLTETLRAMAEIKLAAQRHLTGARSVESQGERLNAKADEMEGLVARFRTDS